MVACPSGWTCVAWDNGGHNHYEFGPELGYDIWKTDEHPRLMEADEDLKIGMTVEKGMSIIWLGSVAYFSCLFSRPAV